MYHKKIVRQDNKIFFVDFLFNLRFGIYSDPDHPGEFVFYTMEVDRIWDGAFNFGDWLANW